MRPRLLLVASEAIPLVKTGGLADVVTALSLALQKCGIDITLLMPGYPAAMDGIANARKVAELGDLPGGPGRLYRGYMGEQKLPVLLLSTAAFAARTANPYVDASGAEHADNAVSFAALAHAAARICAGKTPLPVPHVVHLNDWHPALAPALLQAAGVTEVGTVLTVHNLAFQGNYPMESAPVVGLPEQMLGPDCAEFWGKISFLKAGLRCAQRISIVSESYAREVLTPAFGNGMDGVLRDRQDAIVAIPNGVDVDLWNPANDALIARPYSAQDLRNKGFCKQELLKLFGLAAEPLAPVLGLGSRITHQKMADVALAALPTIIEKHPRLKVVVLGCGDHGYEQNFIALMQRYPERVAVHIGYDEARAHALHAGSDMLLHGTRFEPFGLTPIYAMRYGTIPIASRVGGLNDTVVDAGAPGALADGATGILFEGEQPEDMVAAVDRAFALFGRPDEWLVMQRNAMNLNFSWDGPAGKYIALYRDIAPEPARALFAQALERETVAQPLTRPARRKQPLALV